MNECVGVPFSEEDEEAAPAASPGVPEAAAEREGAGRIAKQDARPKAKQKGTFSRLQEKQSPHRTGSSDKSNAQKGKPCVACAPATYNGGVTRCVVHT